MSYRNTIHRFTAAAFVAGAALTLSGCEWSADASVPSEDAEFTFEERAHQIQRGQYLVTIGGCNDCHTPFKMGPNGPEPDMSRMLSGHPESVVITSAPKIESDAPFIWAGVATNTAFAGPWGVSFARNLTPDENTGIGVWDETIFMNTIRKGRHWGVARPILPPMPWFNYAKMTDDDLKAVFAYLRSIPPIHNRIPEPLPPTEMASATGG